MTGKKSAADFYNAHLKKPPIMKIKTTQSINSSVEPKHQIYMYQQPNPNVL